MGFIEGYKNDVFVTYASADDEPLQGLRTRWVTQLSNRLKKIIDDLLGRGPTEVSIWIDKHGVHGGKTITDAVMENVRQSYLLVVVLSPSYLKSDWCGRELQNSGNAGIFIVETHPIKDEEIPDKLKDQKRYKFWRLLPSRAPIRLRLSERAGYEELQTMGYHIARMLLDHEAKEKPPSILESTTKDNRYLAVVSSTSKFLHSYAYAIEKKIDQLNDWQCIQASSLTRYANNNYYAIKTTIANCDLFIALVGHTYDPVILYDGQELSRTEVEYDFAAVSTKNITIMSLIQTEHSNLASSAKQDDRQMAFRARIQKPGVIDIDFGISPNDIAEKVVKEILAPKVIQTGIPDRVLIESPTPYFCGRDEVVLEIVRELQDFAHVLIWGEAGVGKTEIAKRVAHDPAIRLFFQANIYFISFTSAKTTDLCASNQDMMREIVCGIDPEARNLNMEQWNGLFRDMLLRNQCTLIILDDVVMGDQFEIVLQNVPSTCIILTTAREKIVGSGDPRNIRTHLITPLAASDGVSLLQYITEDSDPRWEPGLGRLAEACRFLPVALTAVGHDLRAYPDADINDYLAKKTRSIAEEVPPALQEMVFKKIQRHPTLIKCWALLSVFEGEFDANAAANLTAMFFNDANALLQELLECRLIEDGSVKNVYRVHSLLKDFSQELSREKYARDVQDAEMRHASYFCNQIHEMWKAFAGRSDERDSDYVLQRFDIQWCDIEKGHTWAVTNTSKNNDGVTSIATRLCLEYCIVEKEYLEFLNLRLSPALRITWLNAALEVVRNEADWNRSKLLDERGVAKREMAEPWAALQDHEEARRIAEDILRENHLAASALGNIGRAYWEVGRTDEARQYYERALVRSKASEDLTQQGRMLDCLGITYRETAKSEDHLQRALELHKEAERIAQHVGDQSGQSRAIDNQGIDYFRLKRHVEAKQCFEAALKIGRMVKDLALTASILDHMGELFREMGGQENLGTAKTYEQDALREAEYVGDGRIKARILGNIGLIHRALGEIGYAQQCFRQQLMLCRQRDDKAGACAAYYHLGLIFLEKNEWSRAERNSLKCLYLAIDIEKKEMEEMAIENIRVARWKRNKG